jgi:AhpC/TSA family
MSLAEAQIMARYWAIAVLGFMAAAGLTPAGGDKDKDFRVQAKFSKDDPRDKERGGPSQVHLVSMKAGKIYTIDMVSKDLDSYLRLLDGKGNQLDEDDDSGGNLNARIIFNCAKDGEYKVVCTTFGPDASGGYTLTVKTTGVAQKPSTAHAQMIGNAAPDFEADFAVNGKAVKVSALRGKVVLLDFCDVRSSSSIALLERLSTWSKAYQEEGLAIVGVTFYPSDINQALGFDDETGTVKTVKKGDRKSDRALLGAFAAHHKVTHVLMALPKQAALDTFNTYVVNGVPQLVLIDRKGVVRLIDLGGEKSSPVVESEIKKLLAEK